MCIRGFTCVHLCRKLRFGDISAVPLELQQTSLVPSASATKKDKVDESKVQRIRRALGKQREVDKRQGDRHKRVLDGKRIRRAPVTKKDKTLQTLSSTHTTIEEELMWERRKRIFLKGEVADLRDELQRERSAQVLRSSAEAFRVRGSTSRGVRWHE